MAATQEQLDKKETSPIEQVGQSNNQAELCTLSAIASNRITFAALDFHYFKRFAMTITCKSICLAVSLAASSMLAAAATVQVWAPVQGANLPGYGGVVRFSQATPDGAFWVMTEGGGLHKSTDGGASWTASNTGLGNLRIRDGVVNTSVTPYAAYAGTTGGGVFKSADNGATWSAINTGLGCTYVNALQGLPGLTARLLAGTDCQAASGVYYADAGQAWLKATGLPDNVRVNSFNRINPTGSGIDFILVNTNQGIYKSTDSGATWLALASSPVGPNGSVVNNVRALYYGTTIKVLRLLATVEGAGVFISEDDGVNWTASNTGLPNLTSAAGMRFDGVGTLYLALDGQGVYKSNDRGNTWTLAFGANVLPSARGVSGTAPNLFADTLAGPYKSTDSGANWIKGGAGLPGGMVNNLQTDTNGTFYAAAADGVYQSAANSNQTTKLPNLPAMSNGHVLVRGTTVFATTNNFGVFKFDGTNWVAMNGGLPANLVGRNPNLRVDSANATAFYLGLFGDGFYYKADANTGWVVRNTGLTGGALKIQNLSAAGSLVYIATLAGVYKSTDAGLNWAFVFAPKNGAGSNLPAGRVWIDQATPTTVYVAAYNTDALGATIASNGVYKSIDGGATWTQLSGMAGKMVRDVRIVGTAADPTLVATAWDDGTAGGLFTSQDGGTTWARESTGLTTNLVNNVISTATGAIVATRGAGLFSMDNGGNNSASDWKYFGAWKGGNNSINYSVSYGANDNALLLSGVTLSSGNLSAAGVLQTGPNSSQWNANLQFGATAPSAGNVYTVTSTPKTSAPTDTTFSIRAAGYNTAFVGNIVPSAGANVTAANPVFSWTAPNSGGPFTYGVEVRSGTNGNVNVWSNYNITGTSITYGGPALTPGTTYHINVQSQEYDGANNTTYGAGINETFCFQCTGTPTGTNYDQLFIGRNSGMGSENFGVSVRFPRTPTDGLASYVISCPNGKTASGQFSSTAVNSNFEWINVDLGNAQPNTPFDCTSTVTYGNNTTNAATITVNAFAPASAYPSSISLAANSTVTSLTTVSFTNPLAANANARVQANLWATNGNGQMGQQLWFVNNTTSPLNYTGSALTPNTNYVMSISTVEGSNVMQAAQVFIPFCYQCGNPGGMGASVSVVSGWNLLGNSNTASLDVATAFGDATKVTTVWKWVPATSKWAFYAPSMTAANLATYAAGKGYDVLTTIAGGEGFWVNALQPFSATVPAGTAVSSGSFANTLAAGWSLIAIGDSKTPRAFNNMLSPTPPTAGTSAAPMLTSLWAWNSSSSAWYFYAPSLDNTNGLAAYTASKQYLDFGSTGILAPGAGFWVNKP